MLQPLSASSGPCREVSADRITRELKPRVSVETGIFCYPGSRYMTNEGRRGFSITLVTDIK